MSRDLNADRLERLRGDLAALRARTAEELTPGLVGTGPVTPDGSARPVPDDAVSSPTVWLPQPTADRGPTNDNAQPTISAPAQRTVGSAPLAPSPRTPVSAPVTHRPSRAPTRRTRAPRPPTRPFLARRPKQPSRRRAVPTPITIKRRPGFIAGPRWPVWGFTSGVIALLVLLPAVAQLAYRLLQAMADTTSVLGADPSRTDYLQAAAGVAGGGLTLALAVAALAVVKGRTGYLAGAVGILAFFALWPYVTYTATVGIVSAPLPPVQQMIQPPGWDYQTQLLAAFWLSSAAFVAAILDLLYRSILAVQQTLTR